MNRVNPNPLKFCFIGNTNQRYLTEFIHLSPEDIVTDFSFECLNLTELRSLSPNIIIIDQYFVNKDYSSLVQSIKLNFKDTKVYFLSPEYANYKGVIQSLNCKNHYFSCFSLEIFNHINGLAGRDNENDNYLEAS